VQLTLPTFLRQNPQTCKPGECETDIHLVKLENSPAFYIPTINQLKTYPNEF